MTASQVFTYVPYSGYPRELPTASGRPMTAVIDATDPASFRRLWGMTLLERNLRLLERLGGRAIHVYTRSQDCQRVRKRRFPAAATPEVHAVDRDSPGAIGDLVGRLEGPVLVLVAQGLYDRRAIAMLWQHSAPAVGVDRGGPLEAPALLWERGSPPLTGRDWREVAAQWMRDGQVRRVDLNDVEHRVSLLRKTVPPQVICVGSDADLQRADRYLKELAGKGVNDIIGEYVHPPVEFFLTRLTANTPLTPNQVSYFIILLSLAGLYFFASGRLWEGIIVNLVRGVVDGVDGKLARLTLRESEKGNLLDHGTDTIYLPLLFLALGWHLCGGDLRAPAALATYLLQVLYWFGCVFASWFRFFLGVDESEFRPIDRLVRRFQPKRNIVILILTISMLFHSPLAGFYAIVAVTGVFVLYRVVRLDQEGRRLHRERARATT